MSFHVWADIEIGDAAQGVVAVKNLHEVRAVTEVRGIVDIFYDGVVPLGVGNEEVVVASGRGVLTEIVAL